MRIRKRIYETIYLLLSGFLWGIQDLVIFDSWGLITNDKLAFTRLLQELYQSFISYPLLVTKYGSIKFRFVALYLKSVTHWQAIDLAYHSPDAPLDNTLSHQRFLINVNFIITASTHRGHAVIRFQQLLLFFSLSLKHSILCQLDSLLFVHFDLSPDLLFRFLCLLKISVHHIHTHVDVLVQVRKIKVVVWCAIIWKWHCVFEVVWVLTFFNLLVDFFKFIA